MGVTIFCLGRKALDSLVNIRKKCINTIDCIVVGRDKNVQNDYADELISWAKLNKIKYVERVDFNNKKNSSSHHISIAWRWLNKVNPNQKLIVLHDSLLPKYRGFNPLVTALINGDTEIGVTAIFGIDGFDKGDIIAQKKISIKYPIKINDAISKLCILYGTILTEILIKISLNQEISRKKQDESKATYSIWRDEEDYFINWQRSASEIKRTIDALGFPYKGAKSFLGNDVILIKEASEIPDLKIVNRTGGKIIFKNYNHPCVICGEGILEIQECSTLDEKIIDFRNKLRLRFK